MDITPFIMLFAVASIVAIMAQYMRLPYTIMLVIVGITVAFLGLGAIWDIDLDKELIFSLLLPPLLFEAGLHMRLSHLMKHAKIIVLLVIPGMILSLLFVAFIINSIFPVLPFMVVLLFAAIIIPTDPISILALFKEMKVSRKVRTVVEGESIFNDGLAIVIFNVILGLILINGPSAAFTTEDIAFGILEFFRLSIFGILLGFGVGYLTYLVLKKIDDRFTEVMITVIVAFGVFALAELLGASGVFAVVVSALVLGNYGTRFAMAPSTRMTLTNFWMFLAFAVNSFLFLLIGLKVEFTGDSREIGLIVVGIILLFISRALMVFIVGKIVNRKETELPRRSQVVVWWGGLRGAIPIALALSIPLTLADGTTSFQEQPLLLAATFGVVLFSLLIQGLTLRPLLLQLGYHKSSKKEAEEEEKRIAALLVDTMDELETLQEDGELSKEGYDWLNARFASINSQLLTEMGQFINEHGFIPKEEYALAVKETLEAKMDAVKEAWSKGWISGATGEKLIFELDGQLTSLSTETADLVQRTPAEVLMRVTRPESEDVERSCGICLESISSREKNVIDCRCGTVFHQGCINDIDRCPICIAILDKPASGNAED